MPKSTCIETDCSKPCWSRGYCHSHDTAHRKSGKLKPLAKETDEQRFWKKVDKTGECWIWTASRHPLGYGHFQFRGKVWIAHRAAWTMFRGEIPEGMELDHICFNRSCVRLDHLRVVTRKQNNEHIRGPVNGSKLPRGVGIGGWDKDWIYARLSHYNTVHQWGPFETIEKADAFIRAKRAELFTHDDAIY